MSNRKFDIIPYRAELVHRARELRKNLTPAERRLWKYISRKQIHGFDFYRQKPLDSFIVDFYCKDLKLAIEIDGEYHKHQFIYDQGRQDRLEAFGIHFLRFSENEVLNDIDNALRVIEDWILAQPK